MVVDSVRRSHLFWLAFAENPFPFAWCLPLLCVRISSFFCYGLLLRRMYFLYVPLGFCGVLSSWSIRLRHLHFRSVWILPRIRIFPKVFF